MEGEYERKVLEGGRPLWEIWEEVGREAAWISASEKRILRRVSRSISRERFEALRAAHPGAPGIIEVDPSYEDDEEGWVEMKHRFYEIFIASGSIEVPPAGTCIYCQTGHIADSSIRYMARVYRATFDGAKWNWAISQELYEHNLRERVLGSGRKFGKVAEYVPCERPNFDLNCKDWIILPPSNL